MSSLVVTFYVIQLKSYGSVNVARDLPGGNRILTTNIIAKHNAFSKVLNKLGLGINKFDYFDIKPKMNLT